MFTILPFETDFYKKYNYDVEYVGNPINDAVYEYKKTQKTSFDEFLTKNNLSNKPIIALLAGSRKQEIEAMLPVMIQVKKHFHDYQFVVAGAPSINKEMYQHYISNNKIDIVYNQTYDLLTNSRAALVTSGTATLETALFNVPQIVCYKTVAGNMFYKIGRAIVKVEWISLVNLILNYEAVKELLQTEFNEDSLTKELNNILLNREYRDGILESYNKLQKLIGSYGASKKTAEIIYHSILKRK
jgi:lipid-A-disaccharide synthase